MSYFPYKKIIKNKWVDDEKLLIANILDEYSINEDILNNIDKNICSIKLVIEKILVEKVNEPKIDD